VCIKIKACRDTLHQTRVFAFGWICGSTYHFSSSSGPDVDPNKSTRDTSHQTCVFAFGGIFGSHSAFWCVWAAKHRCTIIHAQVGLCGYHKKRAGTCYTELVFLHPVVYVGHVVCSIASEAPNVDALFFILGWPSVGPKKSTPGHVTPNLCFSSGGICGSCSVFCYVRGAKR
jgi:hypothetical protein